jgi:hypothetical protein
MKTKAEIWFSKNRKTYIGATFRNPRTGKKDIIRDINRSIYFYSGAILPLSESGCVGSMYFRDFSLPITRMVLIEKTKQPHIHPLARLFEAAFRENEARLRGLRRPRG